MVYALEDATFEISFEKDNMIVTLYCNPEQGPIHSYCELEEMLKSKQVDYTRFEEIYHNTIGGETIFKGLRIEMVPNKISDFLSIMNFLMYKMSKLIENEGEQHVQKSQ